jgi:MFS family permease
MERRGALPYLVGGSVLAALPLLAMSVATSAPIFVAIVVASAVIAPVSTTAYNVVLRDIYPDDLRGRMMGLVRAGRVVMVSASALFTGWLLSRFGFRVIFPGAAVVGVAGALCWLGLRGRVKGTDPNGATVSPVEALGTLWRDRRFAWYSTGYFIFGFSNIMMSPVIPIFQVDVLKITPMWVAVLSTTAAMLAGGAFYFWGHSVDRRGPFRSLLFGYAVLALVPVVYALTPNLPVLLIAAVAGGIAGPGTELSWINVVMRFGQQNQIARYSALHLTLLGIRGLIAPWVGGALIAVWPGMRPIFWLVFGLPAYTAARRLALSRGT